MEETKWRREVRYDGDRQRQGGSVAGSCVWCSHSGNYLSRLGRGGRVVGVISCAVSIQEIFQMEETAERLNWEIINCKIALLSYQQIRLLLLNFRIP